MKKKRAITLLEIMIVILLIGLIGGVVSYNLKGTLDKGKAFASKEGAKKLEDILNLEIQQGTRKALVVARDNSDNREVVQACLTNSGLISSQQIKKFIKDGWGEYYTIRKVKGQEQVVVTSRRYEEYKKTHHTEDSDEPPVETEE
ncbi:MAG TPA: prepilin-type N-terminal cleavage/methylation domain-containing protein [Rhabdochlamydiaceae bacterium]|jgi:type II secretory pathway pseudopilin PulG|nr:prepilin-type N-terminal cleavage/methylation domain-containing protein [Rhabdochlamydiaceae bacterium]